MPADLVLAETTDGVTMLTLNHPEKRNALSHTMLSRLQEHFARLASDRTTRVVILRAAGKVFSSGHDLLELADASGADTAALFALCTDVMLAIRKLPQP